MPIREIFQFKNGDYPEIPGDENNNTPLPEVERKFVVRGKTPSLLTLNGAVHWAAYHSPAPGPKPGRNYLGFSTTLSKLKGEQVEWSQSFNWLTDQWRDDTSEKPVIHNFTLPPYPILIEKEGDYKLVLKPFNNDVHVGEGNRFTAFLIEQ
jgi:hypothetical protein